MTLLVIVEIGDMTQVFESPIGSAGNAGGIDIGGLGRIRVVSSPIVFTMVTIRVGWNANRVRIECRSSGIPLSHHRVPR